VSGEILRHVEKTWDHVLHGNSTLGEKLEVSAEAVVGVAAIAAVSRLGLSRSLAGSAEAPLPKVALHMVRRKMPEAERLHIEIRASSSHRLCFSRFRPRLIIGLGSVVLA